MQVKEQSFMLESPMPAHKANHTKDSLRREALRLFVAFGYNAVSMRDIAAAVGVRQSAIYNHFRSKQDILVELMQSHMETVLAAWQETLPKDGDAAAQAEAFIRFHITYHMDHPEDVFLAYMELRSLEPDRKPAILELRDQYETVLRDILARGRESGQLHIIDPATQARALLAMLTGVTGWFREGGRLSREEIIECYAQTALQSVGLTHVQGG